MRAPQLISGLVAVLSLSACAAAPRSIAAAPPSPIAPSPSAPPPEVDVARARESGSAQAFPWAPWSKQTFARARAEHRFILLHGAAVWCHWCHVMEAITYRDPAVGKLLRERFIAIRVDIDSRPDIAERYGDWGWPATILFSPDAQEVGKFRGYLPPDELLEALLGVTAGRVDGAIAAPAEPGNASAPISALPWLFRRAQLDMDAFYDEQHGGWGMRQKAPLGFNAESELARGAAGDSAAQARALFTLKQQSALIDPVWGGIYQYSVGGDWHEPHFEKLMPFQAANLEAYALAFQISKQPVFQHDAQSIADYVARFLTAPSGAFYVSQDADIGAHDEHAKFVDGHVYYQSDAAARLRLGTPDVDQHVYASENGLMIAALCSWYEATHVERALTAARRAADAVIASHVEASGSVLHDATSSDKVHFLADGASLGRGLLRLYSVTHEVRYLAVAQRIAAGLEPLFDASVGAYFAHDLDPDASGVFSERRHPFEHNVRMARFLSALTAASSDESHRLRAQTVLAAVSTPAALDKQGRLLGEYLLGLRETGSAKKDADADVCAKQSAFGH